MHIASGFSQSANVAVSFVRKSAGIGGASSPNTFLEMSLRGLGNKTHDAFCRASEGLQNRLSSTFLTAAQCLAMISKAPWLLGQYPQMLINFPWLKIFDHRILEKQAHNGDLAATLN